MKTAFIGHRQIFAQTLPQRLIEAIKAEIKSGCFIYMNCVSKSDVYFPERAL